MLNNNYRENALNCLKYLILMCEVDKDYDQYKPNLEAMEKQIKEEAKNA